MTTALPEQADPEFITAAEAFKKYADQVPVIKAWERQDDGSIVLFGALRLQVADDGNIKVTKNGHKSALPLMMTQEFVRQSFGAQNSDLDEVLFSYEPDTLRLEANLDEWLPGGSMHGRLSKITRSKIVGLLRYRADEQHLWTNSPLSEEEQRASLVDQISMEERDNFRLRILARAMGYSRKAIGLAKLVNSFLWADIFDPQIAKAAILAYGFKATTDNYNAILAAWSRPIEGGRNHGLQDLLTTHRAAFPLLEMLSRHAMINGAKYEPDLPELIAKAPQYLRDIGLKPAFWRFLLNCSVPQLSPLRSMLTTAFELRGFGTSAIIAFLNRLADFHPNQLPLSFLKAFSVKSIESLASLLPHMRAVVEGATLGRRKGCVRINADQIHLIADALNAHRADGNPIAHTKNATWNSLVRLQTEWHEGNNFENDEDLAYAWSPLVENLDLGDVVASELTDGLALREEGRTMHHCVAGYAHDCAAGATRIFSLVTAKDSKRRSTLELRRGNTGWRNVQHRTYCNQTPNKMLVAAAAKVVSAVNRAQNALDRQALPLAA